jgi:hypothetical protein
MSKKKIHEIDEGSKVKANGLGYYYCTTTPEHPYGMKLKDRDKVYIYLHRAVLEQKLGRYLEEHEQAHHIDEDKENNHPSNLELITKGEHQRQHAKERGLGKYDRTKMKNPNGNAKKKEAARSVVAAYLKKVIKDNS